MSGGALDASVTLDEVLSVVGARRVPLAPELAGYLVLEIAEQTDPQGGDIDAQRVYVGDEGTVALVRARREAVSGDAEASIRAALARLLEASGSQTPSLSAASRRKNGNGVPALIEELEAALIPVNRAAARRALARLAREVKRVTLGVGRHTLPASAPRSGPREIAPPSSRASPRIARREEPATTRSPIPAEVLARSGPSHWSELPTTEFVPAGRPPSPSESDVDALIAEFGGPGEAAEAPRAPTLSAPEDADVEALLTMPEGSPSASRPASARPAPPATPAHAVPTRPERPLAPASFVATADARQLPTRRVRRPGTSGPSPARAPAWRTAAPLVFLALLAVGGGAYAVSRLRPPAAREPSAPAETAVSALPAQETPAPCYGTLMLTDVPTHAEVLLRQGQAPLDIPRMPVGARLEFVATAEGYSPKRVVVPGGVPWDTGPDGKPRFEAAVQLDPTSGRGGTGDYWPAGEPGSEVGGQGRPGTVHVVATPRGSEIWMLAGIGPEARIDQVRCDQDIDVLVAGPTTFRKRLHVAARDFTSSDPSSRGAAGGRVPPTARISAR